MRAGSAGCLVREATTARVVGTLLGVSVLVVAAPTQACYTGLVVIPTAEVLSAGRYSIELQHDGVFARDSEETWVLNTQFGLGSGTEVGVDFDFSPNAEGRLLLNGKCLLCSEGHLRPALAVGICNIGSGSRAAPYVVGTQRCGATRGHLGLMRTEGRTVWFVGIDHALTDRVSLYGDYTGGEESAASLGGSYQFSERYGLMAGVVLPQGDDADLQFTVHFVISGLFAGPGGKE